MGGFGILVVEGSGVERSWEVLYVRVRGSEERIIVFFRGGEVSKMWWGDCLLIVGKVWNYIL